MIVYYIATALLFCAPILFYLKRNTPSEAPIKVFLPTFALLLCVYCFSILNTGYNDIGLFLLDLAGKSLVLPIHWFVWLRITVKRIPFNQRALPLGTVCAFMMVHGIALESHYVLFAAAVFTLLCYFLCSPHSTVKQESSTTK
jgi:hypothetical protein